MYKNYYSNARSSICHVRREETIFIPLAVANQNCWRVSEELNSSKWVHGDVRGIQERTAGVRTGPYFQGPAGALALTSWMVQAAVALARVVAWERKAIADPAPGCSVHQRVSTIRCGQYLRAHQKSLWEIWTGVNSMQPPFARSIAFSFGKLRMFKTVPAAAARVRLDMSMMEVEMRGHARGFSDVLTVISTRIIYHFRVSTDRNMLSAELLAVRITDSLHDLVLRRRMILAAEPTVYSIVPQGGAVGKNRRYVRKNSEPAVIQQATLESLCWAALRTGLVTTCSPHHRLIAVGLLFCARKYPVFKFLHGHKRGQEINLLRICG
ncbi:hypothetical protein B0H13DRAFT_1853690 [Mycena leptocephala]|nr:hypothetical protein B0H13DRAFT_1853690 [Mycena leptocephala]